MTSSIDKAPPFDISPHVHPELQPFIARLLPATTQPLTPESLRELRAIVPAFLPAARSTPSWVPRLVSGPAGAPDVHVLVVNPAAAGVAPRPAILHMHGGGFVGGSAEQALWRTQELAQALNCLVVSTNYRLAPETSFPGALEDNYAVLKWLYQSADALAVDRERIAVVGESAGGGHAAMLAVAARDRGEIPLRYQGLIYPMLDDRTGSIARKPPHMGAILWNEQRNQFGWGSLLGGPSGAAHTPYGAVPARIDDLRGLPAAWIGVGSIDLFVDEDIDYAKRLIAAGVSTRLNVVPGAFHGFDCLGDFKIARGFRDDLIASLRQALFAGQ